MINLITGYNNTGKTTWIANTISDKHNIDCELITEEVNYFTFNPIVYSKAKDNTVSDYITDIYKNQIEPIFYPTFMQDGKMCIENRCNVVAYTLKICFFNQPENGLHPSLQSKLVEEFVKLHNEGYDIYIETYSDHIINATRVAVKQGLIKSEDVKLLFFKAINEFIEIVIDKRGSLFVKQDKRNCAELPKGFFDEWTNSMFKLL